jgi:hypothetical protein
MRRLKTNDFWEKTLNYGDLLKKTIISEYSQDYHKKCLISAGCYSGLKKAAGSPARQAPGQ